MTEGAHVAVFTRSGNTSTLNVDGVVDSLSGGSTNPRDNREMWIGAVSAGLFPFPGDIAEIRIYDGALSLEEADTLQQELNVLYRDLPPDVNPDAYEIVEDGVLQVTTSQGVLANDTDPDGAGLSASLQDDVTHGILEFNADGSFTYAPEENYFGADSFTYNANDGQLTTLATVELTVLPGFDPAQANPDAYLIDAGEILAVSAADGVLHNDANPDQVVLSAELEETVADGTLTLSTDGSFVFDPSDFVGVTTFTYAVRDAQGKQNTATVTLNVDTPPDATADFYEVAEDTLAHFDASLGVLTNDSDAEGDVLAATLVTPAKNGVVTLAADGSFTYLSQRDFVGEDSFSYRADDGDQLSAPVTVQISVANVNDGPSGRLDRYEGFIDVPLVVSASQGILANDTDIDTEPTSLKARLIFEPRQGTLQLEENGSFTYTPRPGFRGTDTFTYQARDDVTGSSPTRVELAIGPPQDSRSATDVIVTFNEVMYRPPSGRTELQWIEIVNQLGVNIDISDWSLDDDIQFHFPSGTMIPGGGYLVIAADPIAMEAETGFSNALGPFTGTMGMSRGSVSLVNNSDRLMDRIAYADRVSWPAASAGSGATLAKLNPFSPSQPSENWGASRELGGTPGADNFDTGNIPLPSIQINEIPAATDDDFWIELVSHAALPVDLTGLVISLNGNAEKEYVVPSMTLQPNQLLLLSEAQLGFDAAANDRLFVYDASKSTVIDAHFVTNRNQGRLANDSNRWQTPDAPSPGVANIFSTSNHIVINEIYYQGRRTAQTNNTVAQEAEEEWVELANRSDAQTVDLSGWSFGGGFEYTFRSGTQLRPGEFLVVANDPDAVRRLYGLNSDQVVGPMLRRLSNRGEQISLLDAQLNVVDELLYRDGGRWASVADGGGSSLELRDMEADNAIPEAWAASDESGNSEWVTVTYEGLGERTLSTDPRTFHEFLFGLLDDGEMLIDDISVVEDPGGPMERQLIQNGTFDADTIGQEPASWRIIGTQHGTVQVDPTDSANQVLHLIATGPTEHLHNNAGTTLKNGDEFIQIDEDKQYEISFRAKWLSGSNLLHTRLYFNRLARTTLLPVPAVGGTPGRSNSSAEANIGPTFAQLHHWPVVPDPDEQVTVSVAAADPDGVDSLTLWYALDGSSFANVPMSESSDGTYSGLIPAYPAGSVVQFYVEAKDSLSATSMFPAAGPASRALYQVQDERSVERAGHDFRLVMMQADADELHEFTNVMSNNRLGATVIYNHQDVYYDVGVRLKGSQRGRFNDIRVGFNVRFDPEQPFRGVHETIALDRAAPFATSVQEIMIKHAVQSAGDIPGSYDDIVHLITPRNEHTGPAMLLTARFNDVFLDSQYENGSDGTAFEYELIYFPITTVGDDPEGLKQPQPDSVVGQNLGDKGDDREAYRWYWLIKNNRAQDEYSRLMHAMSGIGLRTRGEEEQLVFRQATENLIDVDQWMRAMTIQNMFGIVDGYASGSQHNAQFYVRPR